MNQPDCFQNNLLSPLGKIFTYLMIACCYQVVFSAELKTSTENKLSKQSAKKEYLYTYVDRDHSLKETLLHITAIYGVSWLVYPISQPEVFMNHGSWSNYKDNLGRFKFDHDTPLWNWIIHPISGGQLFLYYRANGYSRIHSLALAFVSSTLFELFVEIYTEPASIQDLYQTPILGSVLGVGIEKASMYLLNSDSKMANFFGHLINPCTLFWFYEGKVLVLPDYDYKNKVGRIFITAEF